MSNNLLKIGDFAKLARTTKRTVLWYEEKGLLQPFFTDESGYRYFKPAQIIDFQVILLLRKLNFSIEEIKAYLKKNDSLKDLFKLKRSLVEEEIARLQKSLKDIDGYYHNLDKGGLLVNPQVKEVKSFDIYFTDVVGAYADIKDYALKLKSYFAKIPKDAIYLTIFMEPGYEPKKAKMRIGVICQKGMQLKNDAEGIVNKWTIPEYKALTYIHTGSGALLSLLWQELDKYRRIKGHDLRISLAFSSLELYKLTSLNYPINENGMIFEIHLPIS